MPRLFGTDGIRGVANRDLTPDLAVALGRAAALVLAPGRGRIVVGRDTRVSGPMLESALVAGICSGGADALVAGIVPTPAVAFLTIEEGARAGAMISASHNPVPDNGIKFFSELGYKIAPDVEDELEALLEAPSGPLPIAVDVGTAEPLADAIDRYVGHLLKTIDEPLTGLRVVLDCAYGSAYEAAPRTFREAGADVTALHAEPDGSRINVKCGSTDLAALAAAVMEQGADIGLAFDGDADRVLAVDERGAEVDGDRLLALAAMHLQGSKALTNDVVVTTVMANLGFRRFLESRGIEVRVTPVGDKHVAEAMVETGAALGGEQSGHVIFGRHSTTGDGILTALQIASVVAASDDTLSTLAHVFEPYPQVLINVPVARRDELERSEALWEEVARAEKDLGDDGRVLLRPSGTEQVVRVMVEAADEDHAHRTADQLADLVRAALA